MTSHHTHDQNIGHTQSFAVAGEKSQMWFGCSCLCSRQRPLVWFSTWWGERWEERIRPDSMLAWFTKSKTCVLCNCLSLFATGRKDSAAHPHLSEQFWGCEVSEVLQKSSRAEGGEPRQTLSLEGRCDQPRPREHSQARGQQHGLLQHRSTWDLMSSTVKT